MKKVIFHLAIPIIIVVLLVWNFVRYNGSSNPSKPDVEESVEIVKNFSYVKDRETGLCFAVVLSTGAQNWKQSDITCVPCDSLKKVDVIKVGSKKVTVR